MHLTSPFLLHTGITPRGATTWPLSQSAGHLLNLHACHIMLLEGLDTQHQN